jgi:hypothetical protein
MSRPATQTNEATEKTFKPIRENRDIDFDFLSPTQPKISPLTFVILAVLVVGSGSMFLGVVTPKPVKVESEVSAEIAADVAK